MTMGTVVVACLAARAAGVVEVTITSFLGAHELGREPGKLIRLALGEPALDEL
jgi:hypothetical protein